MSNRTAARAKPRATGALSGKNAAALAPASPACGACALRKRGKLAVCMVC